MKLKYMVLVALLCSSCAEPKPYTVHITASKDGKETVIDGTVTPPKQDKGIIPALINLGGSVISILPWL